MSSAATVVLDDVFSFELPPRPYPGLRPFAKSEWPIFFGRERMTEEVIERLVRNRFLVVHGDSGCGKSSLIRAGVLPRLEQDCARGGAHWLTCETAPGDDPLANLAGALAGLGGQGPDDERSLAIRRILNRGRDGAKALADYVSATPHQQVCILIDQFEELFAHARRRGPQQATLMVEQLIGLQRLAAPGLCVVLTMRSEFLGACAQFDGFAETVNVTQYLLPRMEHADLMRAIQEPAPLYDGEIGPDLAERLIADGHGSQDQLPLIQHGLMLMHRDRPTVADAPWRLTLDDYRAPGRLGQMLSDHADEVMRSVEPPDIVDAPGMRVTEEVFRALTDINADGQATRRPQKLQDLIAVAGGSEIAVRRVVDAFRADGVSFLRPYGAAALPPTGYVDISHEALIRCWARVADVRDGWLIREFKNGLLWRSLLVQTDSFERDRSNVLSPATTDERQTWLKRRSPAWSERYGGGWGRVLALIEASVAERDRQVQDDLEERARQEQARLQEEQARLREQELKATLATAVEKSRREQVFRWAFVVSMVLLAAAGYFAYAASQAREVAYRARANAELAADDLQKSFVEAEARRKAAETSLGTIQRELAELKQASDAAPANSAIKRTIDQVESSIAQQVTALSYATRLSPRIYVHIADDAQRDAARSLERLIEAGRIDNTPVVVPGIQLVGSAAPPYSLLRCFVADDCERYGQRLVDLVNAQLISPKIRLQDFSATYTGGKIRPQHFELYFAAGPITLARAPASAR